MLRFCRILTNGGHLECSIPFLESILIISDFMQHDVISSSKGFKWHEVQLLELLLYNSYCLHL